MLWREEIGLGFLGLEVPPACLLGPVFVSTWRGLMRCNAASNSNFCDSEKIVLIVRRVGRVRGCLVGVKNTASGPSQ